MNTMNTPEGDPGLIKRTVKGMFSGNWHSRSPKGKRLVLVLVMLAVAVVMLLVFKPWHDHEDSYWEKVLRHDDSGWYVDYLDKYPEGKYHKDAIDSIISESGYVLRARYGDEMTDSLKEPSMDAAPEGQSSGKGKTIIGIENSMVSIRGGTFLMGSPLTESGRGNDEAQHKVTLKGFAIGKYEVTYEQYDAFCDATGRPKPDDNGWGRDKRPVTNVSWHDANAFCAWISHQTGKKYRLPTEAEWEYSCRAGTTTPFSTGDCLDTRSANYHGKNPYWGCPKGESRKVTLPVGSLQANHWGLYDMHGNVWEWCADGYSSGYYEQSPQHNPKGPEQGAAFRSIRGGGWAYYGAHCRSASRDHLAPESSNRNLGFRLLRP